MTVKAAGRCMCGRLAYTTNAAGKAEHPCCTREGPECGACKASDAAERQWQEHGIKWARKVKAHWKAEAERAAAAEQEEP